MTEQMEACRTSPAAMCYWFVASLIAWGAQCGVGDCCSAYDRILAEASSAPTVLLTQNDFKRATSPLHYPSKGVAR